MRVLRKGRAKLKDKENPEDKEKREDKEKPEDKEKLKDKKKPEDKVAALEAKTHPAQINPELIDSLPDEDEQLSWALLASMPQSRVPSWAFNASMLQSSVPTWTINASMASLRSHEKLKEKENEKEKDKDDCSVRFPPCLHPSLKARFLNEDTGKL